MMMIATAEGRNRSSTEVESRDSLINCLLTRVQECEEDKMAMEQTNERLRVELQQLKEANEMLHTTIKQLQHTSSSLDGPTNAIKRALTVDEAWSEFTSMEEASPRAKYPSSSSSTDPEIDNMVIEEDCERIELLPPSSSSIPPPPSPPASVDDLLAFLVWLFLHIAVFIDSHRKVYQTV